MYLTRSYIRVCHLLSLIFLCCISPARANPSLEDMHIIDCHAHVAGLGHGDSGAFINEEMRKNIRFHLFLKWMDVTEAELIQHGDQIVVQRLSDKLARSRFVDQAVVLAMDGVVDRDTGLLNRMETQVYVPNSYIKKETDKYENLLFGASINPYHVDAIERLRRVHSEGAMLIKWIPSIMYIDPSDPDIIPFYKEMVRLNIPLLTHTGMEKAFASARDELADPLKLRLPLETGVTVIAAHIATTGESGGQDNFERILPMFKQYKNLYTDISSLTQINKLGYLVEAIKVPGVIDRMIYGTDWPLQYFPLVSSWYHLNHIDISQIRDASQQNNEWDRDVILKHALGVPFSVFTRSVSVKQ